MWPGIIGKAHPKRLQRCADASAASLVDRVVPSAPGAEGCSHTISTRCTNSCGSWSSWDVASPASCPSCGAYARRPLYGQRGGSWAGDSAHQWSAPGRLQGIVSVGSLTSPPKSATAPKLDHVCVSRLGLSVAFPNLSGRGRFDGLSTRDSSSDVESRAGERGMAKIQCP